MITISKFFQWACYISTGFGVWYFHSASLGFAKHKGVIPAKSIINMHLGIGLLCIALACAFVAFQEYKLLTFNRLIPAIMLGLIGVVDFIIAYMFK